MNYIVISLIALIAIFSAFIFLCMIRKKLTISDGVNSIASFASLGTFILLIYSYQTQTALIDSQLKELNLKIKKEYPIIKHEIKITSAHLYDKKNESIDLLDAYRYGLEKGYVEAELSIKNFGGSAIELKLQPFYNISTESEKIIAPSIKIDQIKENEEVVKKIKMPIYLFLTSQEDNIEIATSLTNKFGEKSYSTLKTEIKNPNIRDDFMEKDLTIILKSLDNQDTISLSRVITSTLKKLEPYFHHTEEKKNQ